MDIKQYDNDHITDLYLAAGHIQHELPSPKTEENLLLRHKILLLARTLELPGQDLTNESVMLLTRLVDRTVDFVANDWPHHFGAAEIVDAMMRPQFRVDLVGVVYGPDDFFKEYVKRACLECRAMKQGAAKVLAQTRGLREKTVQNFSTQELVDMVRQECDKIGIPYTMLNQGQDDKEG